MSLVLKKLSTEDGEDIYAMLQEIPADENGLINPAHGKTYEEYKAWLERAYANSQLTGIVDGWKVPETIFWLYEDGNPVGFGKLRHFLTDALRESGGNIGYAVAPSARGRGLGKALVAGLIEESKTLGIDSLLFTVKNHNTPSIRAAVSNGGVIEKVTDERHYIIVEF